MTNASRAILILSAIVPAQVASGQFVPGHVYISDYGAKPCQFTSNPIFPNDRIWEVDPATGQVTLFATVSDDVCGLMSGLAFTPDGAGLRASMAYHSIILEFDTNANAVIALDDGDGISSPWGTNNITYDAFGNSFVVNSQEILSFPPDGGPATVLADLDDLNDHPGAIAAFPNGDLLYADGGNEQVLFRITPDGTATVFDTLPDPGPIHSVAISGVGEVFALSTGQLF